MFKEMFIKEIGLKEKLMDMVLIFIQIMLNMLENGLMINNMVKVKNNGRMDQNI